MAEFYDKDGRLFIHAPASGGYYDGPAQTSDLQNHPDDYEKYLAAKRDAEAKAAKAEAEAQAIPDEPEYRDPPIEEYVKSAGYPEDTGEAKMAQAPFIPMADLNDDGPIDPVAEKEDK